MKQAPRASVLLALCLAAGTASAQVSLTGPAYTQDFDSLANSGSGHTALPAGWLISESGANANGQYQAGTGSSNSGDTYSFGAAASTDRALGGLLSGSLTPTIGACFTNNVGNEVTALDIAYTGEQWRLGTAGRTDTLNFQYSLDATSLTNGSWVDVDALDFNTPNTGGSAGARDGNDAAYRTAVSGQIGGLAIANGSGFCVRWTDFNASGADDGLAVDDFSLTPVFVAPGADIGTSLSVDPGPVVPGGQVTVRTRLQNFSAVASDPWNYSQTHISGLSFASGALYDGVGDIGFGSCGLGGPQLTLSCASAGSAGNSAISVFLTFNIPVDAQGPLVFEGVVEGLTTDPVSANDRQRIVLPLDGQTADIGLTLADSVDPVLPGGNVTYTATVTNNGPGRTYGMGLSLPLPANTTYVGSTFDAALFNACDVVGNVLECTGSQFVDAGASGQVTLEVQVDAGFVGSLSTTGVASSLVPDPSAANNTATETTLSEIPRVGIHDVQGPGTLSPLNGALVEVEGIVTAQRFNNGFFLQTVPGNEDADPMTSEGIFVFTGSAPPASAAVGNRVIVSGSVVEFRSSANPHQGFLTELTGPTISVVSSGNALPAPVQITAAMMDPSLPVESLEYLEGMRVSVDRLVAVGPTEGSTDEDDALAFPNGNFWGVIEGIARPFREPGVGVQDQTPPLPVNTPRFDTNPERLRIQSRGQIGAGIVVVDTGAVVTGLVGVLDYGFGTYILMPDPGASIAVAGGMMPQPVSTPAAGEFTIAGANMLRFYDAVNDPGGDVALTPLAFERRVAKAAMAICDYMKAPDIVGMVEVENLNALQALADRLNATCSLGPQYQPYLEPGNDVGNINIGFLVNTVEVRPSVPRVRVVSVTQYGKDAVITNPNGSTSTMNDRPPLVLRAELNASAGAPVPVTVIGNHLLSLIDINDNDPGSNGYASNGERRRVKRAQQAVFLAGLVQQFQQANPGERIVLLGDFNAFEFNDGYVDVMGIITGQEAANDAVVQHAASPLTSTLTNLTTLQPASDRYSFSFEGSAQTLDHIVVSQSLLAEFPGLRTEHARLNADFAIDNFGDESIPVRFSDHDPVVLYLSRSNNRTADLMFDIDSVAKSYQVGVRNVLMVTVANLGPDLALSPTVTVLVQAAPAQVDLAPPANWTCTKDGTVLATLVTCQVAGGIVAGNEDVMEIGVTTTLPPRTGRFDVLGWVQSRSADRDTSNNLEALRMPLAR